MSTGRNDTCPCGSGRKYQKCCLPQEAAAEVVEAGWLRMRRTEGELIEKLARHLVRHYGQTPRQAAQTPGGRERLEVLLLDFSVRDEMPPAFRPDIAALRRELGI